MSKSKLERERTMQGKDFTSRQTRRKSKEVQRNEREALEQVLEEYGNYFSVHYVWLALAHETLYASFTSWYDIAKTWWLIYIMFCVHDRRGSAVELCFQEVGSSFLILESIAAQLDFCEKHWPDGIKPQKLTVPTKLLETYLPCTEALLCSLIIYDLTKL